MQGQAGELTVEFEEEEGEKSSHDEHAAGGQHDLGVGREALPFAGLLHQVVDDDESQSPGDDEGHDCHIDNGIALVAHQRV